MPDFGLQLDGERVVDLRFGEFPQRARAALRKAIEGVTSQLLAKVQGAEPLLTGRLRGETKPAIYDDRTRISGIVRIAGEDPEDYGKAAALEYGSKNPVQVTAHSQTLGHVFDKLVAPIEVLVEAYTRHPHIAARAYLRHPLDDMRTEIVTALRAALGEATAEP